MADWLKTMDAETVLCRVSVAGLDRAYRNIRDRAKALKATHPDAAAELEAIHQRILDLYNDAHSHSPGVPLSHKQFVEIGTTRLPQWARD
jgi:hypothetical protein